MSGDSLAIVDPPGRKTDVINSGYAESRTLTERTR
jgi:hypothetical protein